MNIGKEIREVEFADPGTPTVAPVEPLPVPAEAPEPVQVPEEEPVGV